MILFSSEIGANRRIPPTRPGVITLDDLIRCRQGGTVLPGTPPLSCWCDGDGLLVTPVGFCETLETPRSMLFDATAFWLYDNRESLIIDQAPWALAKIKGSSWRDILGAVWYLFKNRELCNYYGLSVAPFCYSHGTFRKGFGGNHIEIWWHRVWCKKHMSCRFSPSFAAMWLLGDVPRCHGSRTMMILIDSTWAPHRL